MSRGVAYRRWTESYPSVVIQDDTVPGESTMRSGTWCACFEEPGPMTAFPESAYATVRVETVTNGRTTRILIYGEADIASADLLGAALAGVRLDDAGSVVLDVSHLCFFDVVALHRLIGFARSVKQSGRDFTTCGANRLLNRVAHTLEVQDDLGLHGCADGGPTVRSGPLTNR